MIFFKNFSIFKLRFLANGVRQKGRVWICLKALFMLFKKRAGVMESNIYRLGVMGHQKGRTFPCVSKRKSTLSVV